MKLKVVTQRVEFANGREVPSSRELARALSLMFAVENDTSSSPDLARSCSKSVESLIFWVDDFAREAAWKVGRTLDDVRRLTPLASVDMELTEALRRFSLGCQVSSESWWVVTGPSPKELAWGVDGIVSITQEGGLSWVIEFDAMQEGDAPVDASSVDVVGLAVDCAIGRTWNACRDVFSGARTVHASRPGGTGWLRAWDANGSGTLRERMAKLTESALRDARVSQSDRVIILAPAQYSSDGNEPKANENFGSPLSLCIDYEGSVVERPVWGVSHACASGLFAVSLAARILGTGAADCVVVAGCTIASDAAQKSMEVVGAVSRTTSRPFAQNRDGMVLGEGGVALALRRVGSKSEGSYGVIAGLFCRVWGREGSAQESLDISEAIDGALRGVNVEGPGSVVLVAHATGTAVGDLLELEGIEDAGAALGRDVLVVSHKGLVGHLLHCSALLGIVHGLSVLGAESISGTWGLSTGFVLRGGRRVLGEGEVGLRGGVKAAVVNALGFGGNVSSVVLMPSRVHDSCGYPRSEDT